MHFNKTPNTFRLYFSLHRSNPYQLKSGHKYWCHTHINERVYFSLARYFFRRDLVNFFFWRDFFSLARLRFFFLVSFFFWNDFFSLASRFFFFFFFFFLGRNCFSSFGATFFPRCDSGFFFGATFFPFEIRFQIHCGLKQVRLSKKRATRWLPKATQVEILLRS